MKELHDNMKLINYVEYKKYQWRHYEDVKVVAVLLGK
jgi:hypothetical protein